MPEYVDGFVIAVPKANLAQYKKMARVAAKVWMELGAIDYRETVSDDLDVKFGRPFDKLVKLQPEECVVFSWITYKSRQARDRINAKVMKDPRIAGMCGDDKKMPFNPKRMSYGGFTTLIAG